jgi:hypothetical protein
MPINSISMCSKTVYVFNVDAGSSVRRWSASTMPLYHHFDYKSDHKPQNLTQVMWLNLFETTSLCQWTAYQCAQTLCMCLMWMQEAVWVAVNVNHDAMTSFWLHMWPRITTKSDPSNVGITVWGICHMPMDSISMYSKVLYMSNVDAGHSLSWLCALTMT